MANAIICDRCGRAVRVEEGYKISLGVEEQFVGILGKRTTILVADNPKDLCFTCYEPVMKMFPVDVEEVKEGDPVEEEK